MLARFWITPYHPARAFLFERGLYLLLALDCWLLMLEHGARYGVGGFNVAHFAWLDRLLPLPGPALYVGLVCASGLLALAAALFEVSRIDKLLLVTLYTLAWALSMHDSYQHHYLLSWLLLSLLAFPAVTSRQASDGRPPAAAPGLPFATLTCCIVYLFTALSKTGDDWRAGHVLRSLAKGAQGTSPFAWPAQLFEWVGLSREAAWQATVWSVLGLQLLIASGYAVCTLRDDRARPWLSWWCAAAWLAALLFHALTELDGAFSIGWFSYYMLWTALVAFAPAGLLQLLCRPIARLRERIGGAVMEQTPSFALAGGSSCLMAWIAAQNSDLPGVPYACFLLLGWFALEACYQSLRRQPPAVLRCAIVPGVALVGLFGALNLTTVRFDYYRRAAGELLRMGELEQALLLYRKAEQHAPAGKTRMTKIDRLQRELEARDAGLSETGE